MLNAPQGFLLCRTCDARGRSHMYRTCTAPKKLDTLVRSSESAQLYRITPAWRRHTRVPPPPAHAADTSPAAKPCCESMGPTERQNAAALPSWPSRRSRSCQSMATYLKCVGPVWNRCGAGSRPTQQTLHAIDYPNPHMQTFLTACLPMFHLRTPGLAPKTLTRASGHALCSLPRQRLPSRLLPML
eukprot:354041-Chlamydomonas_euryale.AAC.1